MDEDDAEPEVDVEVGVHVRQHELRKVHLEIVVLLPLLFFDPR